MSMPFHYGMQVSAGCLRLRHIFPDKDGLDRSAIRRGGKPEAGDERVDPQGCGWRRER